MNLIWIALFCLFSLLKFHVLDFFHTQFMAVPRVYACQIIKTDLSFSMVTTFSTLIIFLTRNLILHMLLYEMYFWVPNCMQACLCPRTHLPIEQGSNPFCSLLLRAAMRWHLRNAYYSLTWGIPLGLLSGGRLERMIRVCLDSEYSTSFKIWDEFVFSHISDVPEKTKIFFL